MECRSPPTLDSVTLARSKKYVVEASDGDGVTIWLADFDAEELELVERESRE